MNEFGADIVAAVHVAFVAFLLVGFVLLLAGEWLGWNWTRNRWLRAAHLAAVAYTLIRTWFGMACPLTTLENWLRRGATKSDALAAWSHRLVFRGADHRTFTLSVTIFAAIVFAYFVLSRSRVRCA